ncbi:MAG: hypothetical protein VX278_09085 [Myxococcota bacterium]|nr:hypothetical protein [Myxococcota bacterium]
MQHPTFLTIPLGLFLLSCSEYGYIEKSQVEAGAIEEEEEEVVQTDTAVIEPVETPEPSGEPNSEPAEEPEEPEEPLEPAIEPSSEETEEGFDPTLELPPFASPIGNVVTILMTLSDTWIPQETASQLIYNSVNFVSPVVTPSVLIVRDDNHNGEDVTDCENIQSWLQNEGLNVDLIEEPSNGITADQLLGYHVVIFSNPGFPPDDVSSIQVLKTFSMQGFGVIFQGDDMTRLNDPVMEELTRLRNIDNGTSYHGVNIDNNSGSTYEVQMVSGTVLTTDIGDITFEYGNDIDTAEATVAGMSTAAYCTVSNSGFPLKPVITAFSPQQEQLE